VAWVKNCPGLGRRVSGFNRIRLDFATGNRSGFLRAGGAANQSPEWRTGESSCFYSPVSLGKDDEYAACDIMSFDFGKVEK
jgi:hypothetical protein